MLCKWGYIATCLDSGSNSPWRDEYIKFFEGKEQVIILPDNDTPGMSYALKIAQAIYGKVGTIKIVKLPGLHDGDDIIDWAKTEGNDKAKLTELVKQTPEWTPDKEKLATKTQSNTVRTVSIAEFLSMKFPPRENVLSPWLPTQGLAMLYGYRGVGKTHIAAGIAVAVSSGIKFLRWDAPKPRGVLYLDGEMPAVVLQERMSRIICSITNKPSAPFYIITPDLQTMGMPNIITPEGQKLIEPYLKDISLVIIDSISTLCRGGRENEAESWLPMQEWALMLRSNGLSVLFIHHAGKGGLQRGTSRREDILDTVIKLKHPGDYTPDCGACFEVHFEKSRGIYGDDVKPFEAKLITGQNGRQEWVMKDLEESLTKKVANLFNDGIPQKEIHELLNVTKGTVSKHKNEAKKQGLLVGF